MKKNIQGFSSWLNENGAKLKELKKLCEAYNPDLDDAKFNDYGEKQKRCDQKHPAYQKFQQAIDVVKDQRFYMHIMHQLGTEQDPYYIATIFGGDNGPGNWKKYLNEVKKLVNELSKKFTDVWIVDWWNDCVDDVYTLRVGVR